MNNNWIENINIKYMNEDKKIVLNKNHNGRVIFIEDNECEILDSKYINDKKNKISWRHIYSYLDNETTEIINRMVYQSVMKEKVLNIHNYITFNNYAFDLRRIVENIYECEVNSYDSRSERERKQKIQEEESWEVVDFDIRDNTLSNKNKFMLDNRYSRLGYSYNYNCKFKKSTGEVCGKYGTTNINLDKEYYSILMGSRIDCCGIHYNQYNKLNKHKKNEKVKDIFRDINLVMKNGVMCKC
jgi:hypothetical protein